jgi:hypothetical protein
MHTVLMQGIKTTFSYQTPTCLGFSKVHSILASELSPDYHGVSQVLRTKGTIYGSIKNILQYTHFYYADEFFMFKCDP